MPLLPGLGLGGAPLAALAQLSSLTALQSLAALAAGGLLLGEDDPTR